MTFSSSLPPFSPEVILAPQFRTDSSTWLLGDFSVSAHFPPVTLFLPLDSKNKGAKKPLSPYHPPGSNLVKSFLGLALNIISRILQPPVLFPPLFSIFNSAPE